MQLFSTKFFQILKTFSSAELKSFELWLKSPWANSNKNLIRLLEKVQKHHPNFDNPKLTKPKLFRQVLPKGKYSDRRMNNLLSEGYLAAERFIIFNNVSKNENLQKDLLTQELQNRHLEDWFFRDINKEAARLEEKEIKDWEDHLNLLRLNRRIYHHPNQNPRMQPGGQTIIKMGEQLDLVFLLEKAAIINEKIFRNRILKNENHEIEQELAVWLTASEGVDNIAIEFYRKRFEYKEETMLEQYFELRSIFLEQYAELNEKEQKVHFFSLLNDATKLYKANLVEISEFLAIYKIGLKTKIVIQQNTLSQISFRTIVAASNHAKDFEYTIWFIDKYYQLLNKEVLNDGYQWAMAHTAYWQKDLEKSLDILIMNDIKSPYFKLQSKFLTTQVYFDLYLSNSTYQLLLFDYFNSFEKWIAREKIGSKQHKNAILKFIQTCRTMAKIYSENNFNEKKMNALLIDESNIQSVKWLNQKRLEISVLKTKRPSIN